MLTNGTQKTVLHITVTSLSVHVVTGSIPVLLAIEQVAQLVARVKKSVVVFIRF